jgi:hypothetical protein
MAETTPQPQGGKKPNWRCGAPAGNRNAAEPVPALSTRIRDLKRRARAAIRAVDSIVAGQQSGRPKGTP